jgi:hypothetical protein
MNPDLLYAQAIKRKRLAEYLELDHQPQVEEVIRNLPVRNPLIWL